jgi:hypothetical protein
MTDNITLPRAVAERLRNVLRELASEYPPKTGLISPEERTALAALDAALAEPEQKPAPRRAYFETTTLPISISISPLPEPPAIARAVEAEREACAKVCESEGARIDASWTSCAAAIRARGSK